MNTNSNIELLRLTAAIEAAEVLLDRERGKLRATNEQGKTTISIEAHIAVFVRRLDRFRALRTNLLTDGKGEGIRTDLILTSTTDPTDHTQMGLVHGQSRLVIGGHWPRHG